MDAMLRAGVEQHNIYTDVTSGAKAERKGLDKMLAMLRRGDEVIVWKLDRLARSVSHLCKLVEGWEAEGIQFRSIQESFIDTTSSHGKFVLTLFSAVAQLERDLIIERTMAGLAAARKRGRVGGRRPGMTDAAKRKARLCESMYKDGTASVEEMCEAIGIKSKATFYKYLRSRNVEPDGTEPREGVKPKKAKKK